MAECELIGELVGELILVEIELVRDRDSTALLRLRSSLLSYGHTLLAGGNLSCEPLDLLY